MVEHVCYIEKTRDYYRRAGYVRDYAWAKNVVCAFTRLTKPLSECRIGLVSTASIVRLDPRLEPIDKTQIMGSSKLEVYPVSARWPVDRLRPTSEDHDRFQTDMKDVNAYFPKDHLRSFAKEAIIGSFADECLRILPNYSQRKVLNVDAPEVLRRYREGGVDAVILTPI